MATKAKSNSKVKKVAVEKPVLYIAIGYNTTDKYWSSGSSSQSRETAIFNLEYENCTASKIIEVFSTAPDVIVDTIKVTI